MSSLPASIKRIGSKTTEKRWRHRFPHYKSMGAFCFHGNQSFDPICPKTLCNLPPPPPTLMMLHINFINIGQLASEIFKFHLNYDRMTEPQNHRIPEGQGKSSIAPLFQSGAITTTKSNKKKKKKKKKRTKNRKMHKLFLIEYTADMHCLRTTILKVKSKWFKSITSSFSPF